jgi:hypothetical protein
MLSHSYICSDSDTCAGGAERYQRGGGQDVVLPQLPLCDAEEPSRAWCRSGRLLAE